MPLVTILPSAEVLNIGFSVTCYAFRSGLFLAVSAYHDRFALFSLSTSSMADIIHEVLFFVNNLGSIL